jgi:hypothetical protein
LSVPHIEKINGPGEMSTWLNGPNLEEGEEFAALCLKNAATKLRPNESSVLPDGSVLYGSLPFVLSDSWHTSLGELRAEQLKRSTVVVLGRTNSEATAHYLNVLFGSLWLVASLAERRPSALFDSFAKYCAIHLRDSESRNR